MSELPQSSAKLAYFVVDGGLDPHTGTFQRAEPDPRLLQSNLAEVGFVERLRRSITRFCRHLLRDSSAK